MGINSKMTALADEVRTLSGSTEKMGIDEMTAAVGAENDNFSTNITEQNGLINQIIKAVEGKAGKTIVPLVEKQIMFIDYDGTLLYSYTPEEVLALNELPSHESTDPLLIFDGWNWTLEELKEEINLIGLDFMQHHKMAVGATYQTLNNNTYLFIKTHGEQTSVTIYFTPKEKASIVAIDWGDNTEPSQKTGTSSQTSLTHIYEKNGEYRICISGDIFALGHSSNNIFGGGSNINTANTSNFLEKIYIGSINRLNGSIFQNCFNLKTIMIANGLRFISDNYTFSSCYLLQAFVGPKDFYYIIGSHCFQSCTRLSVISLPKKEFIFKSNSVSGLSGLRCFHIPSISKAYEQNSSYNFANNRAIETFTFFNKAFSDIFSGSYNLKYIMVKNNSTLPSYFLTNCVVLSKFKAYGNISEIQASAFSDCYSLKEIDLTECESVPTLVNSNAFQNVPSDCKILVPANLAEEWKAATNWSSHASKIVGVEVNNNA